MRKMISTRMMDSVQNVNKKLGVHVKLPNPTPTAQRTTGVITMIAGLGITIAGVIIGSKWTAISGGAFLAGGAASYIDAKKSKE